jgi:hypothetical protein
VVAGFFELLPELDARDRRLGSGMQNAKPNEPGNHVAA